MYKIDIIKKGVKKSWLEFMEKEFEKNYFQEILNKVNIDAENKIIYPPSKKLLQTFKYFNLEDLKVVFIFQDPYIGQEVINGETIPQAMGLATSVPEGLKIPPTLRNIFKEIKNEYPDYDIPKHGNLTRWVKDEGILLLNASLTVIKGKSGSHLKLWEIFTNKIIKYISDNTQNIIFVLLGNYAKNKKNLIDIDKHIIITGVHPSPLSASKGFYNSNIYKNINKNLELVGKNPIDWSIK
jgi:uracil-DNA glycosylase